MNKVINIGLSQCPMWPLGSCNNSWTTGRSDHINCLGFSDRRSINFELQIRSDRPRQSDHINFWDHLDRRSGSINFLPIYGHIVIRQWTWYKRIRSSSHCNIILHCYTVCYMYINAGTLQKSPRLNEDNISAGNVVPNRVPESLQTFRTRSSVAGVQLTGGGQGGHDPPLFRLGDILWNVPPLMSPLHV